MPYVGRQNVTGEFIKLDAITTSATNTFNLLRNGAAFSPATAEQCIVSVNGVTQAPKDAFNISGSQIVFTSTLSANDVIDYILVMGNALSAGVPSDGSVSTAKLANSAVDLTSKVTGVLPKANGGTGGTVTGVTTLTEVATTSGAFQDITVPSTAKVIYVGFLGHSHSGSNANHEIQLGTASGIVTSGYLGTATYTGGGHNSNGDNTQMTDSFPFVYQSHNSTVVYGLMTIVSMGGNKWVYSSNVKTGAYVGHGAGYVSLGGAITTVRIQTDTINTTLDAGSFNVTYIE